MRGVRRLEVQKGEGVRRLEVQKGEGGQEAGGPEG